RRRVCVLEAGCGSVAHMGQILSLRLMLLRRAPIFASRFCNLALPVARGQTPCRRPSRPRQQSEAKSNACPITQCPIAFERCNANPCDVDYRGRFDCAGSCRPYPALLTAPNSVDQPVDAGADRTAQELLFRWHDL